MKKFYLIFFILISLKSLTAQDLEKIGKEGKAFEKGGSIGIGTLMTAQQGTNPRRVPFSWYINGSPTITLYDLVIPFSFVYSEQERNFTQPFNKYGLSPRYKWLTVHAGYRNLYYSDYTLAGATFLGLGVELNSGKFRLGAMYGKFRNKTLVDEENRSRYSYLLPSYERFGYSFKIGFGKGPNFTDLIFFKGEDKIDTEVAKSADSLGIKPMDNIAVGIKSNYVFFKNFDFNIDMAVSAMTLDKRISDSIGQTNNLQFIKPFFTLNLSTLPLLAGNISLRYSLKNIKLKVEYRRVDPEFQTLGSYYITNDLQQYTFSPTFIMLKNKLIVNASYGIRKNNLLQEQYGTTVNKIGSAFVTYSPKPVLGFTLNYSNYGTDLNSGRVQLNDSILFSVINQAVGGSIRYTTTKGDISNSYLINIQQQSLQDNNIVTRDFTESNSRILSLNYNKGIGKKGLNIGGNINYTEVNNNTGKFQLVGPAVNFRKNFKKPKIGLGINASFQQKIKLGSSDGTITNISSSVNYSPHKKHSFGLTANALFNRTSNISIYSFNEQRLSLRYTYNL